MSAKWSKWTTTELERELELWQSAIEEGYCNKKNRIDLLVEDIKSELNARAA